MPWSEVLALDAVQKGILPEDRAVQILRKQGLIEGRKPNFHVAAEIAAVTETEAEYIRHRAFDDRYFCDLILDYLMTFREGRRTDFERLLEGKLSDLLTIKQKSKKIHNLLQKLRREGRVTVDGRTNGSIWRLPRP